MKEIQNFVVMRKKDQLQKMMKITNKIENDFRFFTNNVYKGNFKIGLYGFYQKISKNRYVTQKIKNIAQENIKLREFTFIEKENIYRHLTPHSSNFIVELKTDEILILYFVFCQI